MRFKDREIDDIEIDGVDTLDYPDLCDAYISHAVWADTGKELTDNELDELTDAERDLVHELAHESLH